MRSTRVGRIDSGDERLAVLAEPRHEFLADVQGRGAVGQAFLHAQERERVKADGVVGGRHGRG